MLKAVNINLVGILLASISLIALAGDLSVSSSPDITRCAALYIGSITYAYAYAEIDSTGYWGQGYVEVGLLPDERYSYGFEMEIVVDRDKVIGVARSYSTVLPYFYIHSFKPFEENNVLRSWGVTYIGSIGGPWDASAGIGATRYGWCFY